MAYAQRSGGKLNGRWVCDAEYKHADGSVDRWHKAFSTKGEAEGAEVYFRKTGRKPPGLEGIAAPTHSFEAVATAYKMEPEEEGGGREWYERGDGTNAQRLDMAVTQLGGLDIAMLGWAELKEFRKYLLTHTGQRGKAPANRTVNRYMEAVKKVMRYAVREKYIQAVPEFPKMANKGNKRPPVPREVEDRVCAYLIDHHAADVAFVIRMLSGTGMRRGELLDLPAEQVKDDHIVLHDGDTKTDQGRLVYVPAEIARQLRGMIRAGTVPNRFRLRSNWEKALESIGETGKWTLHGLRHATVTRAKDMGVDSMEIRKMVGHSSILTTEGYYHPDVAKQRQIAEKAHLWLGENRNTGEVVELNPQT